MAAAAAAAAGEDAGMDAVQKRLMFEDECILVDEQDNVVGHESKYNCHLMEKIESENLLHRAFSVFLFNSKYELLLQQRSATKVTFPLVWTNTCCSHPLYRESELIQENYLGVRNAAQRKLLDELGIPAEDVPVDQFTPLGRMLYKAPSDGKWGEHELDYLLFIVRDVKVLPNPDEVADVKYVSREDLKELIRKADAGEEGLKLSPWFRLVVDNFLMGWWDHVEKGTLNEAVDMETIHKLNSPTQNQPSPAQLINLATKSQSTQRAPNILPNLNHLLTRNTPDTTGAKSQKKSPHPTRHKPFPLRRRELAERAQRGGDTWKRENPIKPSAAPTREGEEKEKRRRPAAPSPPPADALLADDGERGGRRHVEEEGGHDDDAQGLPWRLHPLRAPPPLRPRRLRAPGGSPRVVPVGCSGRVRSPPRSGHLRGCCCGGGGQIWSATRIAQASAVEKVISGRWSSSKPSSPPAAPVSVPVMETHVAPPEMERPKSVVGVRELEGGMERGVAPVRPASHEGRVGEARGVEVQERPRAGDVLERPRVGDVPERPKLKLLPRSKPIETAEPSPVYAEEKQVHQVPVGVNAIQGEMIHDVHQNMLAAKTGVAGADAENRAVERPRLNLKPRSNALGQSDESAPKERHLFGGARPREQVLRERGIDALATDLEKTSPGGRSKNEFAKVEQKVETLSINPSGEKVESFPAGTRGPRNADKKDYRRDTDRSDVYRPTRREDNRRIARDVEKTEQPRPEPETWRKPVEPPKPEVTAPRFGKGASALELAQAFSKSMSDTVPQSRLTSVPSPKVPPSPGARDQVGFSRLTDNRALHSGAQRKINGY
uniref:isopentenyl-diphosphate Delta-isomerase n=1 Tax=Leersia perrieri TaxID=77586 RepID=A0A0D9X011_9ORYZ